MSKWLVFVDTTYYPYVFTPDASNDKANAVEDETAEGAIAQVRQTLSDRSDADLYAVLWEQVTLRRDDNGTVGTLPDSGVVPWETSK